jgi:hypothetical protein
MADVNTIFQKTTPTCSNAYLIDEHFCLGNSLDLINSNFTNLSSAIHSIENFGNYFNNIYTVFTQHSSNWLEATNNVLLNNVKWNNDYATVNSLSGNWANEFAVYYNLMYEFQNWVTTSAHYIQNDILNWLNLNFPATNFSDNQIVSVYTNVYEVYQFDLTNFQASYFHDCHVVGPPNYPASGTVAGCFTDCPTPGGPANCNHHGGAAGKSSCDNYLLHCGKSTPVQHAPYTCIPDSGAGVITIPNNGTPYHQFENDQFMARAHRSVYYKPYHGALYWSLLTT